MENTNELGDDNKKNKISVLKKQLEFEMQSVYDEMGVERINKILDELEELEPLQISSTQEERLNAFKNSTYVAKAIEDREEFRQIAIKEARASFRQKERRHFILGIPKVGFSTIIIIAIFCFSSVGVMASLGIFNFFIEWTDTTFNISSRSAKLNTDSDENIPVVYNDYNDIEEHFGFPILQPIYLMENFDLELFEYFENDAQADFFSNYKKGETIMSYDIMIFKKDNFAFEYNIERNTEDAEIYTYNSIDYYILKNNNWYTVAWNYFSAVYKSSGFKSKEEAKQFIESLQ